MRHAARAAAALLVGALGALTAAPAVAAAPAAPDEALVATWDGPTVNLAWDGTTYATSTASFSGTPVVVPGDAQGRTITVTNDGPTDAVLRGWVQGVVLADPDAPDVHHATGVPQGDLYTDLTLAWRTGSGDGRASFRDLAAAGSTSVVDVPLARGASTRVTIVTSLPVTATSGNRANVGPRAASYEVLLRLDGRRQAPGATPTPGDGGTGPRGEAAAGTGGGTPGTPDAGVSALARTGLDVLRAGFLAVVGIGVGSFLLGLARRRRDVHHPVGSGSTPSAG